MPGLPFWGQKNKFVFLKFVGLEILKNLLSNWPFFKSIEVYRKIQKFSFLKTEFGIF